MRDCEMVSEVERERGKVHEIVRFFPSALKFFSQLVLG